MAWVGAVFVCGILASALTGAGKCMGAAMLETCYRQRQVTQLKSGRLPYHAHIQTHVHPTVSAQDRIASDGPGKCGQRLGAVCLRKNAECARGKSFGRGVVLRHTILVDAEDGVVGPVLDDLVQLPAERGQLLGYVQPGCKEINLELVAGQRADGKLGSWRGWRACYPRDGDAVAKLLC